MNVKGISPMTLFSKINTKVAKINKITSGVFLTIILNSFKIKLLMVLASILVRCLAVQ